MCFAIPRKQPSILPITAAYVWCEHGVLAKEPAAIGVKAFPVVMEPALVRASRDRLNLFGGVFIDRACHWTVSLVRRPAPKSLARQGPGR